MEKTATIKAKDLAPATRAWIMNVLHIEPADEDEFTLTLRRPVRAPAPEDRAASRKGLLNVLERLDERTKDIPEQEIDAAIDEALQAIHPRHD
jgi:hypothetical protein